MNHELDPSRKLSRQERRALEREAKKQHERSTYSDDLQTLRQESIRLGIFPSRREQELWKPFEKLTPEEALPNDYLDQTILKVATSLTAMEDSENILLRQIAEYMNGLINTDQLFFTVFTDIPLGGRAHDALEGGMATSLVAVDDHLAAHIQVPARLTLHKETALMLALDLVHESVHVKKIFERYESVGRSRDLREYITEENQNWDVSRLIPEEAEAYGLHAEATIQQFGRGTFLMYENNLKDAATFVRLRRNIHDPRWESHLKSHHLTYLKRR